MTPTETLAHLRALTDPTPDQLREASDLALLATGWTCIDVEPDFGGAVEPTTVKQWTNPQGQTYTYGTIQPHPCADLQDALRWIVPDETDPHGFDRPQKYDNIPSSLPRSGCPYRAWVNATQVPEWASTPALALTIAGLAAKLEDKDAR